MQIVQIGDPAAIRAFVFNVAAGEVDRQPGIPSWAGQGKVGLVVGSFCFSTPGVDIEFVGKPLIDGRGQCGISGSFRRAQGLRQQVLRQARLACRNLGLGFNVRHVVERQSCDGEQQHPH